MSLPRETNPRRPRCSLLLLSNEGRRSSPCLQIYDEFRFLDEPARDSPSSRAPLTPPSDSTSKSRPWPLVALAVVQLPAPVALLVFAIIRYVKLFQLSSISGVLLDLDKPEDFAEKPEDAADLLKVRLGTALFEPCLLSLLGALSGIFWPLCDSTAASLQALHVFFVGVSLLLWTSAFSSAATELNLFYVQLDDLTSSSEYSLFIVVLCIAYVEVVLLPAVTASFAATRLSSGLRREGSFIPVVIFSSLSLLLSATILCFSAYTLSRSTTKTTEWTATGPANPLALYGLGLRETLVVVFILLVCLFSLVSPFLRSSVDGAVLLLLLVSFVNILLYLLNPDRLLALSHNVKELKRDGVSSPLKWIHLLIFYLFVVLLSVSLVAQVVAVAARLRVPRLRLDDGRSLL